jgi:DNA ligase-1
MPLRPMKAAKLDSLSELVFPCWGNPKFDGIRGRTVGGVLMSNSWKPIPNACAQDQLAALPDCLDGELVTGLDFHSTQSALMSHDGRPDVRYMVFDTFARSDLPYCDRIDMLRSMSLPDFCTIVEPRLLASVYDVEKYEDEVLADGHEGLIFRDPDAPYKFGRSSKRDQWMLKYKRFEDSEALVLGFEEGRTNLNPIVPNAYGMAKRPGGNGGKVFRGTLGNFLARDVHTGVEFSCGTGKGLTADLRKHIWDNRPMYLGRIFKYRFQRVGMQEKPRVPSWQGWRDDGE